MPDTKLEVADGSDRHAHRARRKWVSHGLSNRVVYGGLHYGARWLPLPVLHAISTVGNSIAILALRKIVDDIADNYRVALGLPDESARQLARELFFEYGKAVIDVWRLRSEAFAPQISTFKSDATFIPSLMRDGRGLLLVTGHIGSWEMGAVTLRGHGHIAVLGQPELDPNVQEMRLALRGRMGVESIDIGSSTATAFRVRKAVDSGRIVALLTDRSYPEDRVHVPFFGREMPFLRSPALLARFCECPLVPGFFLRAKDGTYFNSWGEPLWPDQSLSADEDARRMMSSVAAALEGVIRANPTQWFNFYRYFV